MASDTIQLLEQDQTFEFRIELTGNQPGNDHLCKGHRGDAEKRKGSMGDPPDNTHHAPMLAGAELLPILFLGPRNGID